jgi:hypothetical protein
VGDFVRLPDILSIIIRQSVCLSPKQSSSSSASIYLLNSSIIGLNSCVRICEYNKRRKELGIKISSGILTGSRCSSKNCKWEDDGGDDDSRDCSFVVRESRSDLGRRVEGV